MPIEHAIVGQIPIPGDLALFSGEALPGEGSRQRQQVLFCQSIHWASVGGAMHTRIDPLAPRMRLAVEIIKIGKRDACPQALLHHAYRALDFPFGLSRQLPRLPL